MQFPLFPVVTNCGSSLLVFALVFDIPLVIFCLVDIWGFVRHCSNPYLLFASRRSPTVCWPSPPDGSSAGEATSVTPNAAPALIGGGVCVPALTEKKSCHVQITPFVGAPLFGGMGWPEVEALPQTCKMFPEQLLEPNLFSSAPPPQFPGSSHLEAYTLFMFPRIHPNHFPFVAIVILNHINNYQSYWCFQEG